MEKEVESKSRLLLVIHVAAPVQSALGGATIADSWRLAHTQSQRGGKGVGKRRNGGKQRDGTPFMSLE